MSEQAAEVMRNVAIPANVLETPTPAPANDTVPAKTDTPTDPKGGKGADPETPAAPPAPVAEVAKVDKLERAKVVARQRFQQNQQRQLALAEAQRQAGEAQRYQQLATQERTQREAMEKQIAELRDPMAALGYLEKIGLDPKTLTQKAIEASSPEARLKAELTAAFEARLTAVQEAHDAQLRQLQERENQAVQAAQQRAARERFISEAGNAEQFPAVAQLVGMGPEWRSSLLEEATRVLQDAHRRTGYEYTNEEVLSYLDAKYSKILTSNPITGTSKSKAGTEATKDTPNGSGAEEKLAAGGSRTLTNKEAQVKGSLPPDFDSLSDADQKKALAAMLRQLSRG